MSADIDIHGPSDEALHAFRTARDSANKKAQDQADLGEALVFYARSGSLENIQALLGDKNFDAPKLSKYVTRALELAVEGDHGPVLVELIDVANKNKIHWASHDSSYRYLVAHAARYGAEDSVKIIIDKKPELNFSYNVALHELVYIYISTLDRPNAVRIATMLLEAGADLKYKPRYGISTLKAAQRYAGYPLAQIILDWDKAHRSLNPLVRRALIIGAAVAAVSVAACKKPAVPSGAAEDDAAPQTPKQAERIAAEQAAKAAVAATLQPK